MSKQSGYRARITIFVPVDHGNLAAVGNAVEFLKSLKTLPSDAPEGTVIESFGTAPGRRDGELG